jgi:hypothetical protein
MANPKLRTPNPKKNSPQRHNAAKSQPNLVPAVVLVLEMRREIPKRRNPRDSGDSTLATPFEHDEEHEHD